MNIEAIKARAEAAMVAAKICWNQPILTKSISDIPIMLAELAAVTEQRDALLEDMRVCAYDEAGEFHGACMCNFCAKALNCPDEHRDPEEAETRCDFKWRGERSGE